MVAARRPAEAGEPEPTRLAGAGECRRRDSNPHCQAPKDRASANGLRRLTRSPVSEEADALTQSAPRRRIAASCSRGDRACRDAANPARTPRALRGPGPAVAVRPSGPSAASPRARTRGRCTAPPRPSPRRPRGTSSRITPVTVLPYICFSPNAPQAVSTCLSASESSGNVSPSASRNVAELRRLVGGDPEHVDARVVELGQVVAEVAGLRRAAGGAGGRVEVDDHAPAAEVGQRDGLAVGVGKGEVGGGVTGLQAFGHGSILATRTA